MHKYQMSFVLFLIMSLGFGSVLGSNRSASEKKEGVSRSPVLVLTVNGWEYLLNCPHFASALLTQPNTQAAQSPSLSKPAWGDQNGGRTLAKWCNTSRANV